MGQKLVRQEVEDGLRLYNARKYEAAVGKWKRTLHKARCRRVKFAILGYLATAHCDVGKYRDMLAYSVMQIDLANETESSALRAEAYLNLAQSDERLGDYHKSVSYARLCLQNQPQDGRVHGYVRGVQGGAYLGFGHYSKSLESLEQAMTIARAFQDNVLEMNVYTTLGHIFTELKDYEKGLGFHLKAAEFAKSLPQDSYLGAKFTRLTCANLAISYAKLGMIEEAMQCAEEALKLAVDEGDRPTQARCLYSLAEIYRKKPTKEFQKTLAYCEAALSIVNEMGHRYGQMEVLSCLAKWAAAVKQSAKVCECKALDYNKQCLDIARSVGNKIYAVRCHARMEGLLRSLDDHLAAAEEQTQWMKLLNDMDFYCGVCSQVIGAQPDRLEALVCCHVVHARCEAQVSTDGGDKEGARGSCSKCIKVTPNCVSYI